MLLFEQDWEEYPTAIPDYSTSNESFLNFVAFLDKEMGVKNCQFPLTLLQPGLIGVDPFSPDLTEEEQAMIKMECKFNPWYFIREVFRVPPVAGDTPIRLIANRANISLWWCFLNHIDYFLIQPRQTGKSVNADGISIWYQMFGAKNSRANLFTKNGDLIKENIARLKKMRKLLPHYLIDMRKTDTDNQKEFTYYSQGNRLVAVQAQASEDAALNVGRGLTAPFCHVDEVAFLKFVHISVGAMLGGTGAAREQAEANGMPYGNIFTTTAGKIDTEEGGYAYRMLQNGMPWSEMLYDSPDRKELYKTVRVNCRTETMLINGTFSHRQLGFSDQWLRERIAASHQSGDDVRRDFLNQWTAGSLTNPLPTEVLEKIRENVRAPKYEQRYDKEGYIVRWYVEVEEVLRKMPNRQIVLGLDTSNAVGRDCIAGVMLDVSTLEVVGMFSVNDSTIHTFSAWLAKFMVEYKNITVIPEAKNVWIAILDYLLVHLPQLGVDPGRRIYSQIVDKKNESERDRRNYNEYTKNSTVTHHYNPYRTQFGFPTNGPLRELLYTTVIQEAGKRTATLVRDQTLASEIGGLVTRNGRIDHGNGRHDDHVIAWLMVHWFLSHAMNLDHYGIDKTLVKRKVYEAEHKLTWQEQRERERQEEFRDEITQILERMGGTRDDVELMKLEHRLNSLYRRIDQDSFTGEYGSIDALIQEASEKRSRARSEAQSKREGLERKFDRFGGRNKSPTGRDRVIVEC